MLATSLPDLDGDGIGDDIDADDDNDSLSNMYEFSRNLAQADAGNQLLDPDGDGYSNLAESQGFTNLFGTDPFDATSKPEPPGGSLAAMLSTVHATSKDDVLSFWAIATLTNSGIIWEIPGKRKQPRAVTADGITVPNGGI